MTIRFHIVNCTKLHNRAPHECSALYTFLIFYRMSLYEYFEEVDFMRLSLRLIYEQLAEQYPALSLMGSTSPGLTEVQIFFSRQYLAEKDVLYVILDDSLTSGTLSGNPGHLTALCAVRDT